MKRSLSAPAVGLALLVAIVALAAALPKDTTVRLSVGLDELEPDADCDRPAISGNGRYVAFGSSATNLVDGDGNAIRDIFLCDTKTLAIERISVDAEGGDSDGSSNFPTVSSSGRYVCFTSAAADLVPFDGNSEDDIFVRDRKTGETVRVSVSSAGTEGHGESDDPAISANGRYIAFESDAEDLVEGDLNLTDDIFLHDRKTGETIRVSVATDGDEADGASRDPAISANGRYIAFISEAADLVGNDGNGTEDIFVHDRKTGETLCASVDALGEPQGDCVGRVALSAKGRHVLFHSTAAGLVENDTNGTDLTDIFVFDRVSGVTERVNLGPGDVQGEDPSPGGIFSHTAALSGSGRYAVFPSAAENLVEGGTTGPQHVYVRDRKKHVTLIMSLGPAGVQGDGDSTQAAVSKNGKTVAFASEAENLVDGDAAGLEDVLARRW